MEAKGGKGKQNVSEKSKNGTDQNLSKQGLSLNQQEGSLQLGP